MVILEVPMLFLFFLGQIRGKIQSYKNDATKNTKIHGNVIKNDLFCCIDSYVMTWLHQYSIIISRLQHKNQRSRICNEKKLGLHNQIQIKFSILL